MINPKLVLGLILIAATSLGACHQRRAGDVVANDPFSGAGQRPEDQFGKGFAKAYRAPPNSEPMNVVDGDLIPVSATTEPVEIN